MSRENAVPQEPAPTTRICTGVASQPPSGAADEVDADRDAVEVEARPQLVLEPVAVVARDQARVVDEDAEARRSRRHLRAVEQIQPLASPRRRLPRLAQLGE